MHYLAVGALWGLVLYGLLAAKERLIDRSQSPDERIRFVARIGGLTCLAMIGWELFQYFNARQTAPVLLALTGMLGGFQIGAEAHWHISVGRHMRRRK